MYKMYASNPDGVMISFSVADAKKMLSQKPRLVEDGVLQDNEIDVDLFWLGVCYKEIDSEKISTPGQINTRIKNPITSLAGGIKLAGWSYEKEVRLCALKRLYPGQRLAVRIPERINVVLCPGFDKETNRSHLATLEINGIHYEPSVYDHWIRI